MRNDIYVYLISIQNPPLSILYYVTITYSYKIDNIIKTSYYHNIIFIGEYVTTFVIITTNNTTKMRFNIIKTSKHNHDTPVNKKGNTVRQSPFQFLKYIEDELT